MIAPAIRTAIRLAADRHRLDPLTVAGLVMVESGGNPYAWNPEPAYRYLWDVKASKPFRAMTTAEQASERPPTDFLSLAGDRDQEWWGQQASWGLMQVMGAVARERGFSGPYLPELCDVAVNLEVGCRHLAVLFAWASGNLEQALAAYNGGFSGNFAPPFRTAAYAAKVLSQSQMGGLNA